MRGSSRAAASAGAASLRAALAVSTDSDRISDDLFAVGALLDDNAALRRAITDPSRDAEAKAGLVEKLFGGKVTASASDVVAELARQRWAQDRDFTDTLEKLAVDARLAGAQSRGNLAEVEGELFRFERIVAADPELADALGNRRVAADAKAAVVDKLLDGKVDPASAALARRAVTHPRGRRFDATVNEFLKIAAERQAQQVAVVTSAVPLSGEQLQRLTDALSSIYGTAITTHTVVDPQLIGGVHIQIGDDVIDGSIARKLDHAQRHIGG